MGKLDGKVALISGGARGQGAAEARTFVREGARVVFGDVRDADGKEVQAEIHADGGDAVYVHLDVTSEGDWRSAVQVTTDRYGKLDILVNNAGITRDKMFHAMTEDIWNFVLDVNLRTAYNATRAAVDHMRSAAKGETQAAGAPAYHRKITFTSSTAGLQGNPGQSNYATAKMGLIGLTRTLSAEFGQFHINVNAVAPGFIETRLTASKEQSPDPDLGMPEGIRNLAMMMIPLGYAGQPEDVAKAHLFLASPDSDYVSGQTLVVAGGLFRY